MAADAPPRTPASAGPHRIAPLFLPRHPFWAASAVALILPSPAFAVAQQAGSIRGVVYDKDFDAPLARARVLIVETGAKVEASDDGNYVFNEVPPGRYTLVFSKDGFIRQVKADVVVNEGQLTDVDMQLAGEFEDMDEFVVQEIELGGSEGALLKLRLESPALLDSVGSELMNRAGASDAASALTLVSGATVQDGKFAVVRGLPDRYVSSQLNGIRLPTADEEKRAVQLDQFPSAVIESVQVSKTFTPDQQGDASGGAVNVVLKGIPEETSFQFKGQLGYNSQAGGRSDFLSSEGGGVGTWGFDNGGRDIQEDNIGGNWTGAVGTSRTDSPVDSKWSLSGGGKAELDDGVKIGGFASFFYERDSAFFENGIDDSYWVDVPGGPMVPQTYQGGVEDGDFKTQLLDVTQGSQQVQWGGLGSFGIETENHLVTATFLYTHDATDTATLAENTRGKEYYFEGYDPYALGGAGNTPDTAFSSPYIRLQTLEYTERTTQTVLFSGRHTLRFGAFDREDAGTGDGGDGGSVFGVFDAPILDWSIAYGYANLYQPDKTQFGSLWLPEIFFPGFPPFLPPFTTPAQYVPYKPDANFTLGNMQRIFKEITENNDEYALNLKFPFSRGEGMEGYLKFGAFTDSVEREFTQETFSNFNDNSGWEADWSELWSTVFPDQDHPVSAGPPLVDVDYSGNQKITAFYAMLSYPIVETVDIIGGARIESTTLGIVNYPEEDAVWFPPGVDAPVQLRPGDGDVDYSQDSVLPSLGVVWETTEEVTLRAAFSQTVARQTFRELSPILQQEFLGGPIFIGNPNLVMSSLNNYDLRADWTPQEGSFLSASLFYKQVYDAIEYVQRIADFDFTTPVNYPEGELLGLELELRQDIGKLGEDFERFTGLSFGANATIINSQVTLPEDEAAALAGPVIQAPMPTRDMTGAPAYLVNFNLTYDLEDTGTQMGLFYTITGDTLVSGAGENSGRFVPNIYTTEFGTLNFTFSQELLKGLRLFFQAKNLLNPPIETVYRSPYIGADVINTSYTAGIDFAVGLSFQLDF